MAEKIYYENSKNKVRQNFVVSEDVLKQWTQFCKDIDCKSFPLDIALTRFMNEVREGKIELLFKFNV